jgi:membrane protein DedA with SNARE-associated domain
MDTIVESYGLVAVCVVLFLKGAGLPIPIPGDVLLLGTAAQAASGRFVLWQAFVAVLLAILLGGAMQYMFARGGGRRAVYRFGSYVGLTPARLDAAAGTVRRAGVVGIALLVLTPGVRSAAIPACGLASVPWRIFVPGLVVGSSVDIALHFALGIAGNRVVAVLFNPSLVPWIIVGVLVLLAAGGLLGWMLLRRRQGSRRQPPSGGSAIDAWQQAACPVCLALGVALRPGGLLEEQGEGSLDVRVRS